MPKISIVLPTYNGQNYIRKSIDSIINQSFTDWELIIVNDCSTDSTPEIIRDFKNRDSRIRIIDNVENMKLPQSLNIGFKEAKGEYLTWTSDDNIYLPNAIETLVTFLDRNLEEYMVCAGMDWIDENDIVVGKHIKYTNQNMLVNDCVGACFAYRRDVLNSIGEYDTTMFLVEDYEYWLRILFHYGNISYIDETLYLYRMHSQSLTGSRKNEIHLMLLKLRREYFNQLISRMSDNKAGLCELYFDFLNNNCLDDKMCLAIEKLVPELSIVQKDKKVIDEVIVYGAGTYGGLAYHKYCDKILYFADRDENKIGTYINGVKVISVDKMAEMAQNITIVVASALCNIYSFLYTLKELGVKRCVIFTKYDENRVW